VEVGIDLIIKPHHFFHVLLDMSEEKEKDMPGISEMSGKELVKPFIQRDFNQEKFQCQSKLLWPENPSLIH
jgi:hypothetical protein